MRLVQNEQYRLKPSICCNFKKPGGFRDTLSVESMANGLSEMGPKDKE